MMWGETLSLMDLSTTPVGITAFGNGYLHYWTEKVLNAFYL